MKKILVVASGSVAVEKITKVINLLKEKYEVRVIATQYVQDNFDFSKDLGFENENPNLSSFPKHIEISKWADLIIVVPASANTIAKFNSCIADNFVLSTLIAARNQIIFVPAMNNFMYKSLEERNILKSLSNLGHMFIGPVVGKLREGETALGRMVEPEDIVETINNYLQPSGKIVLLPYGASKVRIDPVRYITNGSTGSMGIALSNEMKLKGFVVHSIDIGNMTNTEFLKYARGIKYDIFISPAAFSDFTTIRSETKIKKGSIQTIELSNDVDIISTLQKININAKHYGFKLDTNRENAVKKMKDNNLDGIIWNKLSTLGNTMSSGEIILKDKSIPFENISKTKVSQLISNELK